MLHQGLILTSHREYAQAMRQGLLAVGDSRTRIDVEMDALRAMQLAAQQYELILLDTMLGAVDGLQLLLLLKQQAPATRVIIISDLPNEFVRAQAYQNGADLFLERPRTPEGLTAALGAISGLLRPSRDDEPLEEEEDGPVVGLADIVQMRCLSGDSVLLSVRSQKQRGDIFIFRGEVFHAQFPGKSGEGAFLEMIGWDGGLVRIKALKLTHVPPRTIETPYRVLLGKSTEVHSDLRQPTGNLRIVTEEKTADTAALSAMSEAPPRGEEELPKPASPVPPLEAGPDPKGETPLPQVNSHWRISLSGELMEGSKVADPDRCAFITSFIYRKLADVAVALEVDYFTHMTLLGPHLQQVLVADNMGVRHAVFDTAWTREESRVQYVKWCCEQSL